MTKTKLPRGTTGAEVERRASWTGRHPRISRVVLLVVTSLLVSALLVEWQPLAGTRGLEIGKPAPSDIRATIQIAVTDEELTYDKRRQAREAVPDVFEYDVLLVRSLEDRIERAFGAVRRALGVSSESSDPSSGSTEALPRMAAGHDPAQREQAQHQFEEELGVQLHSVHLSTLESARYDPQIVCD